MKKYRLLTFHMNPNPDFLFGHAEVAGMLATNDPKVSTFEGYRNQCDRNGITHYNEQVYNEFMAECGRI